MRPFAAAVLLGISIGTACSGTSSNTLTVNKPSTPSPTGTNQIDNANSSPTPPALTLAERLKKREGRTPDPATANVPLPPIQMRPGPEDTEIGTAMNSEAQIIEVRTFPRSKVLQKIEATWTGPKAKSLRYYFRDGTTRDITTDQIENLANAPVTRLLQLGGRQ